MRFFDSICYRTHMRTIQCVPRTIPHVRTHLYYTHAVTLNAFLSNPISRDNETICQKYLDFPKIYYLLPLRKIKTPSSLYNMVQKPELIEWKGCTASYGRFYTKVTHMWHTGVGTPKGSAIEYYNSIRTHTQIQFQMKNTSK